jgi:hypothetical protein
VNQSGVDQEPIEAPRLRTAAAIVEQAPAALEDAFLFGE